MFDKFWEKKKKQTIITKETNPPRKQATNDPQAKYIRATEFCHPQNQTQLAFACVECICTGVCVCVCV